MHQRIAIVFDDPGSPDVFRVACDPAVPPAAREVGVRVAAAGVHPADLAVRSGIRPTAGGGPHVIGMAIAGVVDAVGEESRWRVGDRVMGMTLPSGEHGGGYRSHVVAPDDTLVAVPESVDLVAAAALPMNGHTAIQALRAIEEGDGAECAIGVVGAAGALGSVLVSLAAARGHRVVAVAREDDRDAVIDLGARMFVPAGDGLADRLSIAAGGALDAIVDLAVLDGALLPAVRPGGALVTMRGWPGSATEAARGVRVVPLAVPTEWRRGAQLAEVLGGGHLSRPVRRFAPHDAAWAHRAVAAGGLRENVVLVFE